MIFLSKWIITMGRKASQVDSAGAGQLPANGIYPGHSVFPQRRLVNVISWVPPYATIRTESFFDPR
jgi:hypothetical protein